MRWWWDPLCTRPTRLVGFYCASSLKQQSADRHVAHSDNIILIPSSFSLMLSGEATNTNFIVFVLIRSGLEPTIYRTRGEYVKHRTTDAVVYVLEPYVSWPDLLYEQFEYTTGLIRICKSKDRQCNGQMKGYVSTLLTMSTTMNRVGESYNFKASGFLWQFMLSNISILFSSNLCLRHT